MTASLSVTTERVDDIPLLLAQLARMSVRPLLDAYLPTHGNWQGLSLGTVSVGWLTFILSQGDHRLDSPAGFPWSCSACRTHLRRVFAVQPILPAIDSIAAHCDSYSPWCSNTSRTARFRTSSEYLLFVLVTPSSQEVESPEIPERFSRF